MLAKRLNSGFRGILWFFIVIYAIILTLNLLAKVENEIIFYPNIFYNYFESLIKVPFIVFLSNQIALFVGLALVGYIISNEEIVEKVNYFPFFIFLLLNASISDKERVSSFLLSNVIFLYVIYRILDTYRKENVLSNLFNASFWASVSLFLNIINVFIFPVIFISLFVLRPFNWRELIISLLGAIAPVFIYECLAYLVNFNQWYIFESLPMLFSAFKLPVFSIYNLPLFIFTSLLLIVSIFYYLVNGLGNTVKKQKSKSVFFWFILFVLPSVFTPGMGYVKVLSLFSIPISFLVGEYLFQVKRTKITNIIVVLLIFTTVYLLIGKLGYV